MRRIIIGVGVLAAVALASTAMAKTYTLRIGSGHPSKPVQYVSSMEHFFVPEVIKRVKARTKHEVKFIQSYAGTVAKVHQTLEAVQQGRLDIGGFCQCFEPTKAMGMNLIFFVPFTTTDIELQVKIFRRILKEFPGLHNPYEKRYNQKLIAITGFDDYGLGTKFAWTDPSELKGHKISAAGPNLPWLTHTGAIKVTTTLPTAYNDMKSGVAEGILIFPASYWGFKFHEVAPYFKVIEIGAVSQISLTMNLDTRKRLPKEIVAIIDEVAREYEVVATRGSSKKFAFGIAQLKKVGAKVSWITPKAKLAWATALKDWPNKMAQRLNKRGYPGSKAMRAYMQYLRDAGHKFPVDYVIK